MKFKKSNAYKAKMWIAFGIIVSMMLTVTMYTFSPNDLVPKVFKFIGFLIAIVPMSFKLISLTFELEELKFL